MGLTFEKNNQLEKMLDKFAILPDDPKKKKAQNSKDKEKNKDKTIVFPGFKDKEKEKAQKPKKEFHLFRKNVETKTVEAK